MTISKTVSVFAMCVGLSATACATWTNGSTFDTSHRQAAMSFDPNHWLYLESCDACEQGVPQRAVAAGQAE